MPIFINILLLLLVSSTPRVVALQPGYDSTCDYSNPPPDLDCTSPFSSDYYGLGVRMGVYFNWLASWIANNFVPEEVPGALDANTIFMLALMVSAFQGTVTNALAYIDGLILMQLCAGYLFGCFSLWGYRTVIYHKEGPVGIRNFGGFGTHSRLVLMLAIASYGSWFWLEGIKNGLSVVKDADGNVKPCQCYPLQLFFFRKFMVLGSIRYFYISMSFATTAYFAVMLVAATTERIRHLALLSIPQLFWRRAEYETGLTHKELTFLFQLLRFGNLAWMVFSIITVEFTLNYNWLVSVTTQQNSIAYPSQLLPLLIGLFGFTRVAWLAIHKRWQNDRSEERHDLKPLNGRSPTRDRSYDSGRQNTKSASARSMQNGKRSTKKRLLVTWLPWLSQFAVGQAEQGYSEIEFPVLDNLADRNVQR